METGHTNQYCIVESFNSPDYQLVDKIGEGGFGQVYKAVQRSTQKTVAIKFLTLHSEISPDKKRRHIERFHRESDLSRRLSHPNIVSLIDIGQQDDSLIYAVYEYIDGHTLKSYLEDHGPFSAIDAAEVMACVLDALSHAHEKGVIHRDIKPANIMLYNVGAKTHVKVLDFGIGALKNEVRQLDYKSITLTQETLGTPSYSAPEQLRGEPPIAQTDIYVWGLVFLECITGEPTITGRSLASIFHQQLSPTNVPLGVLAGHCSAQFLRRVLNKKSHLRPHNTAELYHEFCKLNFSNLTGDLSHSKASPNGQHALSSSLIEANADTLISNNRFVYSQLTERKQISVLSVILTTQSLAAEMQIEQDVIDTFHSDQMQQCVDIAIRFGACHVGSLGDSLLFFFGYPSVTDSDSRLCSRAALEIASNVNNKNALLKSSHAIVSEVKMGIEIGLMMSIENNVPEGKVAHTAMELCRQAQVGQIICTESVHSILDSYAHFDGLGKTATMNRWGGTNTAAHYLLRGERQSEAFGFLRGSRKHLAFVGREREMTQLLNLLKVNECDTRTTSKQTRSGKKHLDSTKITAKAAHIFGEAGIGKSRLVIELRDKANARRHFVAQCLPEHKNNALYPVLSMIKQKFSLRGLSDEQSLHRIKLGIDATSLSEEHKQQGLLILCAWLSISIQDISQLSQLSTKLQKDRLFSVLTYLLCQETQHKSVYSPNQDYLYIVEDLHWSDPATKEFIDHLIQSDVFAHSSHVWINTSREFLPDLIAEKRFIIVEVNKLIAQQAQQFISDLFNGQRLAQSLMSLLIERTDGIPLFIEELTSSLQRHALVHKVNGLIDFVDNDKQSQVPITLRESLQQGLDRLSFSKDTAQLAATIGRSFDYSLLISASSKDEAQVQRDLNELIQAELVFLQRKVDGDSYIFKHALVRDAAYESMSQLALLESHKKLVSTFEAEGNTRIQKSPLIYIEHLFRAGYVEKGFDKSVVIGTQLSIEGNFIYSMSMTEHALCNLYRISSDERARYEADLLLTYSMLLMTVKGFGSTEYKQNIKKIHALPLDKLDIQKQCSIYFSLMINYTVLSELKDGAEKYGEFYNRPDIPTQFKALIHFVNALIFHSSGDKKRGINEYNLAKEKYDVANDIDGESCTTNYRKHIPYDLLTGIHMHHALALLECDDINKGSRKKQLLSIAQAKTEHSMSSLKCQYLILAEQQLELASEAALKACDPHTMAYFYVMKSQFYYYVKNYNMMKKFASKAKDIATENKIVTWKSLSTFLLGWVRFNIDDELDGFDLMHDGYAEWSDAGAVSHRAWMLALLAQSYFSHNNIEQSQYLVKESLSKLNVYGEKRFEFDIYSIYKSIESHSAAETNKRAVLIKVV